MLLRSSTTVARDATLAQSGEQARALWALREGIAEAQRREGPNIKHDISVPVSAVPRFLDDAGHLPRLPPAPPPVCAFRASGSPGPHPPRHPAGPEGVDAEVVHGDAAAASRIVHDLVAAAGGSISAEHAHRQQQAWLVCPVQKPGRTGPDAGNQRRPTAGILNPGKVL